MGKANPLSDVDLAEFIEWQKTKADSPKSLSLDVATIDLKTFDLFVKNPSGGEEIAAWQLMSAEVLGNIKAML